MKMINTYLQQQLNSFTHLYQQLNQGQFYYVS